MPNTKVPNEQTEFARNLYDKGPTCKEDTTKCYKQLPRFITSRKTQLINIIK